MKIYHYTSIDTLALIIKNQNIRFNRLDFVDDREEALYGSGPTNINLGQYTFVSCWTRDSKENLALWNMYTKNKGVRIGLDEDMFVTYNVNEHFESFFNNTFDVIGNAMVSPYTNESKLYDVVYVDNVEEHMKNMVERIGETGAWIKTDKMGLFKKDEWSFQKECRFKINVNPINPNYIDNTKSKSDLDKLSATMCALGPSIATNTPVNFNHIDITLKKNKLDCIEVMMGPMTTEDDKITVEHLLAKFSHSTVVDSYFKGKIRK